MKRFDELKKLYSHRTEITFQEYDAAKNSMENTEFQMQYLREVSYDSDTGRESTHFYRLEYDREDAKLLLLEEIRKNTANAAKYTLYIWTYILVMLILGGTVLLINWLASL